MSDQAQEFRRSGRKVVLLTFTEAEALMHFLNSATTVAERTIDNDFGRAVRVLYNQVHYLNMLGKSL